MRRQEAEALLARGECPRWIEVGWLVPPDSERRLRYGHTRKAHRVVASRLTGAWYIRCRSAHLNLDRYRLLTAVVGWPTRLRCRKCANPTFSYHERRGENRISGLTHEQLDARTKMRKLQHRRRVLTHMRKQRAVKRAWLDTEIGDDE